MTWDMGRWLKSQTAPRLNGVQFMYNVNNNALNVSPDTCVDAMPCPSYVLDGVQRTFRASVNLHSLICLIFKSTHLDMKYTYLSC